MDGKPPFWATREFKWLVLIVVMAASVLAVLRFEILPLLETKGRKGAPAHLTDLPKAGEEAPLGGALAGVEDKTPIEQLDEAYDHLADYVSRLDAKALSREASEVDYHLMLKRPAELRGRALRVTALYLDAKPIALERREPPGGELAEEEGVEYLYRVFLMDPSGNEGFVVDLVEPPPRLERRTLVTCEAIFFKIGTYEGGKGLVQAPQLVGRELRLLKQTYAPTAFPIGGMILSAALLSLALLLVTFWLYRQGRFRARSGPRPLLPKGWAPRAGGSAFHRPKPAAPPAVHGLEGKAAPPAGIVPTRRILSRPRGASGPRPLPAAPRATARRRGEGQRRVFGAIAGCAVLLSGMMVFNLYQRFKGKDELDWRPEWEKALGAAALAHGEILDTESKAWKKGAPLEPGDFERLRGPLQVLEENAERLAEILEATYQKERGAGTQRTSEMAPKLLEVKLWVLDAADLVDSEKDASLPPGFHIPLHAALDALHRSQEELAQLERTKGEIQGRGAAERERTGKRLLELKSALEATKDKLSKLEEYVKKGLARDDLTPEQLPDLGLLREGATAAGQAAGRVEELMDSFR